MMQSAIHRLNGHVLRWRPSDGDTVMVYDVLHPNKSGPRDAAAFHAAYRPATEDEAKGRWRRAQVRLEGDPDRRGIPCFVRELEAERDWPKPYFDYEGAVVLAARMIANGEMLRCLPSEEVVAVYDDCTARFQWFGAEVLGERRQLVQIGPWWQWHLVEDAPTATPAPVPAPDHHAALGAPLF